MAAGVILTNRVSLRAADTNNSSEAAAPQSALGGGHQLDQAKFWFGQGGAGMEFRFTPHMGIFLDAHGVVPNETKYYGVARLVLSFVF